MNDIFKNQDRGKMSMFFLIKDFAVSCNDWNEANYISKRSSLESQTEWSVQSVDMSAYNMPRSLQSMVS